VGQQATIAKHFWQAVTPLFVGDLETQYSSQGYAFKLFGGPVDWKANKQKTVTLSVTESELLTLSQTGKETLW
jgi:hypothetical protein